MYDEALYVFLLTFVTVYCIEWVVIILFMEGKKRLLDQMEECPRCGRMTLALEYHMKRCFGRPRGVKIDAQAFKPGQRRW